MLVDSTLVLAWNIYKHKLSAILIIGETPALVCPLRCTMCSLMFTFEFAQKFG